MAIAEADVVMYRSQVWNDDTSNGGRIDDTTVIPAATRNNVFPLRESSYLTAGGSRLRKVFVRTEDNTQYPSNIKMFLRNPSRAGDRVLLRQPGGAILTDTAGSLGLPTYFGAGGLDAGVSAGATSIDVLVEEQSDVIFRTGEEIRISDGTNTEYNTISGSISFTGSVATINLTSPLANGYAAYNASTGAGATVSSVCPIGDRVPAIQTPAVTSAAGTVNAAQITVQPDSAIPDTITMTFTSATNFTASGVAAGSLGSGAIGATFAPTNPVTGAPYFSIPAAFWGGTFTSGDTVEFVVDATVWAVWLALITPAGMASVNPNTVDLGMSFEAVLI